MDQESRSRIIEVMFSGADKFVTIEGITYKRTFADRAQYMREYRRKIRATEIPQRVQDLSNHEFALYENAIRLRQTENNNEHVNMV